SSRPPGPGLALSLLVGFLGIVIGIVAVVAVIIPFADHFSSDSFLVPGDLHRHLKHERYLVYQREGFSGGIAGGTLTPGALTVTAPDRSTVPVQFAGDNETFTRGSTDYDSVLSFEPPASGDYTLTFTNRV